MTIPDVGLTKIPNTSLLSFSLHPQLPTLLLQSWKLESWKLNPCWSNVHPTAGGNQGRIGRARGLGFHLWEPAGLCTMSLARSHLHGQVPGT